jgi:hypothetical protein
MKRVATYLEEAAEQAQDTDAENGSGECCTRSDTVSLVNKGTQEGQSPPGGAGGPNGDFLSSFRWRSGQDGGSTGMRTEKAGVKRTRLLHCYVA